MLITVILFLIPLLLNIRINFIGSISVGEILLIAASPFSFVGLRELFAIRRFRVILTLLVLYLASLMVADFVRGTGAVDYLRGWFRIAMTIFAFIVIGGLIRQREDRVGVFMAGFALSAFFVYGAAVDLELLSGAERFKYSIGPCLAILVFLLISRLGAENRPYLYALPLVLGLGSLLLNSRSLGGIVLLATAVPLVVRRPSYSLKMLRLEFLSYGVALVFAVVMLVGAYNYAAPRGHLGEAAREKYVTQADKSGKFTLLAGRDEVYYTIPKIIESPFLGWGSWYKDWAYVFNRTMELGNSENGARYISDTRQGLVPSHSHLFGGWMEAGLIGGVFWAYVLFSAARPILLGSFHLLSFTRFAALFVLLNFAWDIVFSPYAGERRVWTGFMLLLVVYLLEWHERIGRGSQFGKQGLRSTTRPSAPRQKFS